MYIDGKVTVGGKVTSGGTVTGAVSKAENVNVSELHFSNRYEFPNIGESGMLYIASDENAVYRFDEKQNVYALVGVGFDTIECRLKEEE